MKVTIKKLLKKKNKSKIICLTAYSKIIAQRIDRFCDLILVGDSLANIIYGMKNTHSIDLTTMINHAISVRKGVKKSLLVVDMPYGTYSNLKIAKKNAKLILKKTKSDAVKIESNNKNFHIIRGLVREKINVMGHIGFTPQFKKKFKIQGSSSLDEKKLIKEALNIQKAGAFSVILECIAESASKKITKTLNIPTIGIGASVKCDGQILVTEDMLGISGFYPKFVKKYADLSKMIENAVAKYSREVKNKKFPNKKNSY
jgi:3-methyl-2-oxobutanoate hydroxymethyltransferase